ncbi:MAG: universal stress protein, partial [Deltaproteobacteria bacterium]|nr:universal stress protein [Deltaproteobacteria bacterium]
MIILAHDGSIYSDWVARYALHFSAVEGDRKLLVLYVQDGKISPEIVAARFDQLAAECSALGVEFLAQQLPLGPSVHRTLRQAIPHDPEALLICGTRLKPRHQRYLGGSVSEKLLRTHQCPVLALRVVQPGLLGNPHDLLLPLAGHRHGFRRIEPIIRRMASQIRFVQMCRIMLINPMRHTQLSSDL